MCGHIRVHIINQRNSDVPMKYVTIKTEHTLIAVVRLVNNYNCPAYDWMVKDEWNITWHYPNGMLLDATVSPMEKKDTTTILF